MEKKKLKNSSLDQFFKGTSDQKEEKEEEQQQDQDTQDEDSQTQIVKTDNQQLQLDQPLPAAFFKQDVVSLAKALLGKVIVRETPQGRIKCMITQTEAYKAPEDQACHASKGQTQRTQYFWLEGGHTYMFSIYGNNWCFNITAAQQDQPEAVLIRSVEPLDGIDLIRENRPIKSNQMKDMVCGPAQYTQAMDIDQRFNGHDLRVKGELYITEGPYKDGSIEVVPSKRINIDYAQEWIDVEWRFTIKGSNYISV